MKKILLSFLTIVCCFACASAATISMSQHVAGIYDANSFTVPDYYVVLSDNTDATYDSRTAAVSITKGYLLQLDLYNEATDPAVLIPGTYQPKGAGETLAKGMYDPDYSELSYYEENAVVSVTRLDGPVEISCTDDGIYTVTTTTTDPVSKEQVTVTYVGRMPMVNANEKPTAYTMMKHDVDVEMNGGIAFYQGVTDYSNNGVTYLNFYSGGYNEAGSMTTDGYNLAMMIAHKRFVRKSDFQVVPGTYENATNLARDTWYPCREIEYSFGGETVTMPFGSFIRERKNGANSYGYLKSGTLVVNIADDGKVYGTLDAYTDLGYHVEVSFNGDVALNTDNAVFKSAISDLTDDVEMDFSGLDKGRIYHSGLTGGCRTFTVHLGSPVGEDAAINYGGDLLSMEFLCPQSDAKLAPGLYTVVPRRWNSDELAAGGTYDPMSLNKGYFSAQGAQIGTRYAHFREGSYCVYDCVGPAEEGTVRVSTTDYVNYTFEINLVDDAGFQMNGLWENKPLEYRYNADALQEQLGGISDVTADGDGIDIVMEGRRLVVINGGNAPMQLLDLNGRTVATGNAAETLDLSQLSRNVYILRINNQSFKIVLK